MLVVAAPGAPLLMGSAMRIGLVRVFLRSSVIVMAGGSTAAS